MLQVHNTQSQASPRSQRSYIYQESREQASAVKYRTQKEVHTAIAKNTLEKRSALHQMVREIYILTCRRVNSKWIKDLNCKTHNSSDY